MTANRKRHASHAILGPAFRAIIVAALVAVAAPAGASAATRPGAPTSRPTSGALAAQRCGCRLWANAFSHSASARRRFDRLARRKHIRPRPRREVKSDLKHFGDDDGWFCRKNDKVCKAAVACAVAAYGVFEARVQTGASMFVAVRDSVNACVLAVVSTLA